MSFEQGDYIWHKITYLCLSSNLFFNFFTLLCFSQVSFLSLKRNFGLKAGSFPSTKETVSCNDSEAKSWGSSGTHSSLQKVKFWQNRRHYLLSFLKALRFSVRLWLWLWRFFSNKVSLKESSEAIKFVRKATKQKVNSIFSWILSSTIELTL